MLVASRGSFASLFYSGAARQRGKRVVDFKMGYPFITAMDQTEGESLQSFSFFPQDALPLHNYWITRNVSLPLEPKSQIVNAP